MKRLAAWLWGVVLERGVCPKRGAGLRRGVGVLTLCLACCFWSTCLWSSLGLAQATSAQEAFERGTRAFEAGDAEAALIHMQAAFSGAPDFRTAAALGQVELHLRRYRDAAEHLEYSLRHYPATETAEVKGHIMRGLAEARARVASISIEHQIAGARLEIDGRAVVTLPVQHDLFVEPGRHEFRFVKPGFTAQTSVAFVPAGSRHTLRVALEPLAPSAGAGQGARGTNPVAAVTLMAGGVLTLAALGTGVGLQLSAESAARDARDLRERLRESDTSCAVGESTAGCSSLAQAQARSADRRAVASASFVGAGAIAALTVGLYTYLVFASSAEGPVSEQGLDVRVFASPDASARGGQFGVLGRF